MTKSSDIAAPNRTREDQDAVRFDVLALATGIPLPDNMTPSERGTTVVTFARQFMEFVDHG